MLDMEIQEKLRKRSAHETGKIKLEKKKALKLR